MKRRLLVVTTIVLVLAMALMVFVGCNDENKDKKDDEDKPAIGVMDPTKDYTIEEEKAIITKVFCDMCDEVVRNLDKYEHYTPSRINEEFVTMIVDGLDKSLGVPKHTTKIIATNEIITMVTKDKNYPIEAENITGTITCVFDNDFYVKLGKWTSREHEKSIEEIQKEEQERRESYFESIKTDAFSAILELLQRGQDVTTDAILKYVYERYNGSYTSPTDFNRGYIPYDVLPESNRSGECITIELAVIKDAVNSSIQDQGFIIRFYKNSKATDTTKDELAKYQQGNNMVKVMAVNGLHLNNDAGEVATIYIKNGTLVDGNDKPIL